MHDIRELFAANQIIILSIYGQVFFVLGLAIALQSWQRSRLALARTLKWLAAFGLAHGLHEWGHVFIPIQATYLERPLIEILTALQSVLLAASFMLLFQFGVELLRPLPNSWRWLRWLPTLVLIVWLSWAFWPALAFSADTVSWNDQISMWARYAIGFPGAALSAYALWGHARHLSVALHLPRVQRSLRVAALALAGYSITAGLAVPPGEALPARLFNTAQVESIMLVPVPVWRAALGFILTVAIIRSLDVFQVELDREINRMEEEQVLIAERERIGRELHDGTLQTIYAAGLLLQTVERDLGDSHQEALAARVREPIQLLNRAVADIRGSISTLHAISDGRSLAAGLQELAGDQHLRSLVEVRLALDLPEGHALAPTRIGHLLAIAQEALSNCVRHAAATLVHVHVSTQENLLRVAIRDNGRGLPEDVVVGYGLRNMRDRARLLNGTFTLASKPGRGTTVTVEVPWRDDDEPLAAHAG